MPTNGTGLEDGLRPEQLRTAEPAMAARTIEQWQRRFLRQIDAARNRRRGICRRRVARPR